MLHTPLMGLALYNHWKSDGSPYRLSLPMRHLFTTLTLKHGYTVYYYPDRGHLIATPAEDHTPYSETGWPIRAAYGVGWALDIMPHADSRMPTPGQIAQQIIQDKLSGHPATAPVKYINWTDAANNCWHDKWQPNHARTASGDRGHTHISQRSDMDTSLVMLNYDPVAELLVPEVKEDRMIIFAMDEATKKLYRCDGITCVLVPDTQITDQTYVYAGLGTWGEVGSKVNAVGPAHLPAVPVRPGDARMTHLTVYSMGPFGQVASSGGGNVNFPPYTVTFTGTGTSTPA